MAHPANDIAASQPGRAPVLLLIPQGLTVTGVNTWAIDLAAGLAGRGRTVGLAIHGGAPGHAELDATLPGTVQVFRAPELTIEGCAGDIEPIRAFYADGARRLGASPERPAVLIPTRHGDCFGAAAALTRDLAHRLLLWQHVDDPYERAVIDRYAPAGSALAAVSAFLARDLARRHPATADRVVRVPNPAHAGPECPAPCDADRVELLYAGRLEHRQKRVRALIEMSHRLADAGFVHRLTLLGDGVAADELRDVAGTRPSRIRVMPPVAPAQMPEIYARAHAVLLASRTEGLSCAVLEAMSAGRCPIITRTRSGADELVEHGRTGMLVEHDPREQVDVAPLGAALATAVVEAHGIGFDRLGQASWERARSVFSPGAQLDAAERVLALTSDADPTPWPDDITAAFSAAPGDSAGGSVPADGLERLLSVLDRLGPVPVALHGAGAHTMHLLPRALEHGHEIVAVTDDDPAQWGGTIAGVPIVPPDALAGTGAADLVISSWMHEAEIVAASGPMVERGLRVHRLYADAPAGVSP